MAARHPGLFLVALTLAAAQLIVPLRALHAPPLVAGQPSDDPDRVYAARLDRPEDVPRAIAAWKARLAAQPTDGEAAWKLARALYWMGAHDSAPRETRRAHLQDGIAAARRAIAIAPSGPDGHFWLAANMGLISEIFGRREGLRYHDDIRKALDAVIAVDPSYLRGAAQRALGRWYATVPGLFGGDKKKGEALLRHALATDPRSPITLVLLAELLMDTGRRAEARQLLESAIAAPPDPDWAPEDEQFKRRARERLTALDPMQR